ncbi:MAG: hypothetical protein C4297_01865 [Gemmataceae bacterium]
MPQVMSCPACRSPVKIPDELIGRQVRCPTCQDVFTAAADTGQEPGVATAQPAARISPAAPPPPKYHTSLEPHRGGAILTLGILSLVLSLVFLCLPLGLPLGFFAWSMGNTDLRKMREGRMDPNGLGVTQGGQICGIIGSIFCLICIALICLWMFLIALERFAAQGN